MNEIYLLLLLKYSLVCAIIVKTDYSSHKSDLMTIQSDKKSYYYLPPIGASPIIIPKQPDCYSSLQPPFTTPLFQPANRQELENPTLASLSTKCQDSGADPHICLLPPVEKQNFHTVPERDPLLAALILSTSLGLHPKIPGFNHPDHLPLNPYLALLLSHYGKYAPIHGTGRGIYGYAAANNYHNNKPFGAYKIYDDS